MALNIHSMDANQINQVFFWLFIIEAVLGVLFLCWNIWQLASSRKNKEIQLKEKQLHKAQVKIWQHFANGISQNLFNISEAIRTNKLDNLKAQELGEITKGIGASASALYTSLNEERLFTDDEIKQRQLENEKRFKAWVEGPPAAQSPSSPISR